MFGALTAVISWVLGAVVMAILALVHAEVGSMYQVAGGSARYPHFSFGRLAGFTTGWIVWVGAVAVAPIEVVAQHPDRHYRVDNRRRRIVYPVATVPRVL